MRVSGHQSVYRFIDDPDAGDKKKDGLNESGEVLNLAMPVVMAFVGGFIRYAHGEIGDDGSYQVEPRVKCFG